MKIYVLSVMFSADQHQKKSFVLTSAEDQELLPIIEIVHPEFFYKTIFHQLKTIFVADSIKVNSECNYSFLSVQDELSVKYAIDHYDFISKDDLIITYGGIILKYRCLDEFAWTEYKINEQYKGYCSDMNLNLLLNNIVQKSVL